MTRLDPRQRVRRGWHEFADSEVDAYNQSRFAWLASHIQRQFYCDEAMSELGEPESIADMIGTGQYMEAREVYGLVWEALNDELESRSDS